ncbi:MAG: enoyl-CoA hydratase/isomerase family protein [Chitinispirillaceae bacterium]|nr:enoyl-CoA hydratase/isomerase family protein [Chitinispirillaceae bacterium]
MDYQYIKVVEKFDGAVTEITLSSAPGNVLALAMMREIAQQMNIDEQNPHKKLVVFGAEGKHFSFGASVEEHTADRIREMLPYFHSFIGGIVKCPIPTLAKVSGLCLGGAFEFVLACTFICADESAKFGLPEIVLGVYPPPACVLLPARAGDAVAAQMILTGDQVETTALRDCGLLTLLVEKGKLDGAIDEFFTKRLQNKSASSLRLAHTAGRRFLAGTYDRHIGEIEEIYLDKLVATDDANEGINAFLEKRPAQWKDA